MPLERDCVTIWLTAPAALMPEHRNTLWRTRVRAMLCCACLHWILHVIDCHDNDEVVDWPSRVRQAQQSSCLAGSVDSVPTKCPGP